MLLPLVQPTTFASSIPPALPLQQTLAFFVALPLTIGLLMLLGWHVHLVLHNKTTIEYQEVSPKECERGVDRAPGWRGRFKAVQGGQCQGWLSTKVQQGMGMQRFGKGVKVV